MSEMALSDETILRRCNPGFRAPVKKVKRPVMSEMARRVILNETYLHYPNLVKGSRKRWDGDL